MTTEPTPQAGRRDFLKAGAAAAGAALTTSFLPTGAYAAGTDEIRVGIIGAGGRGQGAAHDVLRAAKNVKVVALSDVFKFRVDECRKRVEGYVKGDKDVVSLGNKADVEGRCFVGLDAYKEVLKCDINYVILATPPGFRPLHLEAAVEAGKNIFTEKPVGVDGPGITKVLKAYEAAKKKKLGIVAGTQRRHQRGYVETMKRVHDGEIGDVVAGRCYWNQGILWKRKREKEMTTDVAYQCHNWYGYTWLSGDHIVEQHVHNIDVLNWALKGPAVKATAMGFRTPRDLGYGHIYDFFAVDFEYPKGVHVMSMCRQISGCANKNGEELVGTKGTCTPNAYTINGKRVLTRKDKEPVSYIQEHTDLIESIRKGEPLNELKTVAESTLTAIMGRMSAYDGRAVSYDQALKSDENLMPKDLTWETKLPLTPPVAVPGRTRLIEPKD